MGPSRGQAGSVSAVLSRTIRHAREENDSPSGAFQLLMGVRRLLPIRHQSHPLRFWIGLLNSGMASPEQVFRAFLGSTEFTKSIAPVARLYFAHFGRFPDYRGLEYWVGRHQAGMTLQRISAEFSTSPEFAQRNGDLDDVAFVQVAFGNVLGRSPDAEALRYWVAQLGSGAVARGNLIAGFSEDPDFVARIAPSLYVTMMFFVLLRRTPDPEGFEYFVRFHGTSRQRAALARVLDSAEYRSQFESCRA
jgi:hypothetical protein